MPPDRETSKRRGTETAKPRATATCEYLAGKYNSVALANLEGFLSRTGITAIAYLPWNRPGPTTEASAADHARAPPYDPSTQTRHLASLGRLLNRCGAPKVLTSAALRDALHASRSTSPTYRAAIYSELC